MLDSLKYEIKIGSAFFFGGLLGAGIALLIAPRSGQETRTFILDNIDNTVERVEKSITEAKAQTEQLQEIAREMLEKQQEEFMNRIDDAKKAVKS